MPLENLARLIRARNENEAQISAITGRPGSIGHLGEYVAAKIFDIRLAESATYKAIDGWFNSGPLEGRSVNIKWYACHETILDICVNGHPDYYLVLCGPKRAPARSIGPRPWLIHSAYLFSHTDLCQSLTVKIGIATSVKSQLWADARIFPEALNGTLTLSQTQVDMLRLFQ